MVNENLLALDTLKKWGDAVHIDIDDDAIKRFSTFIDLLIHYQKQTNLTGFDTPEALVRELFIDSLQILRLGMQFHSMLDVGTGAGFPAFPIKFVLPNIELQLVEPRQKRYAFLRLVERELDLKNISILKNNIENVVVPDSLNLAISKAFAPLPEWLAIAWAWAENGTDIACLVSLNDWNQFDFSSSRYQIKGSLIENNRVYAIVGIDN